MNTLTQPSPGVGQKPNGQPPGGDAIKVLRLAKGAPHFTGGTGYAELDHIQLT